MDDLMVTQALVAAACLAGLVAGIWLFAKWCDRHEKRMAEKCPFFRRLRDNNDIDCQADLTDFDGGDD
jgi:hypothetical protein